MPTQIVRPVLPNAPQEYDPQYMNQLVRALNQVIDEIRNPVVNLSSIPDASAAPILQQGDIYVEEGTLKIVQLGDVFINGVSAETFTGQVGVIV